MSGHALLAAVATVVALAGVWLTVAGLRPVPPGRASATRTPRRSQWIARLSARTRGRLLVGLAAGVAVWLAAGWVIALVVGPVAVAGIPALFTDSSDGEIRRLEAMEEWTRSLSGVLSVGVGLEQAIVATLRSTPPAIRPEVSTLAARLRSGWPTVRALRAFADDLDDATGDQIADSLILGSTRRGAGLASVLDGLAQNVADDVRIRRTIEADRAKPRSTARWITFITLVVIGLLALNGTYIAPYGTGFGQLILTVLLVGYVGGLVWLRSMTRGRPLPRFLTATRPTHSPSRMSRARPADDADTTLTGFAASGWAGSSGGGTR
jgi:Flp pilus assembly protein TadB